MSTKLQGDDFKTESELVTAGGTKAGLLKDSQVYITSGAINKTLDDAITDGDIGGGGGGTPAGTDGQVQYNNSLSFGGSSDLFFNDSTIRLGVGTSSPDSTLHVRGSATQVLTVENTASTSTAMAFLSTATNNAYLTKAGSNGDFQLRMGTSNVSANIRLNITATNGHFGVGDNVVNPIARMTVVDNTRSGHFSTTSTSGAPDVIIVDKDNSSSRAALQVQGNGGAVEVMQAFSNGNMQFGSYGSGTLVTDASGNITASSDIALKEDFNDYNVGLNEIDNLSAKSYRWKEETGLDTKNTYVGFIAQDVEAAGITGAVFGEEGNKTLSDRPIIAALVNAVKELSAEVKKLKEE